MTGPELSVVLVGDRFETVREVIGHLGRQTVRDRLELLIAMPSGDATGFDEGACAGFHSARVVEVDSIEYIQPPRVAAIRSAEAPLVLIAETHCFPEPDSLAALIERHREPWTVVAQVVTNANPDSAISWANLLMDYGPQLLGTPGGEVGQVASHNASYKRAALIEIEDELVSLLEAGDVLHETLVARGGRLFLEEGARTAHLNVSRVPAWPRERVAHARAYAARRAQGWGVSRRALYILGAPLIPVVRLVRMHRHLRRHDAATSRPRAPVPDALRRALHEHAWRGARLRVRSRVGQAHRVRDGAPPKAVRPLSELPSVSVVVPTRDRPDQLPTCLDGIAKLDYPRDRLQVIVVDDSGGGATVEADLDVELIATDRIGPAGARNAGVERAEGTLLAFIDDDCYPRPEWLARLVTRWQEAPAEAVGGHTVNALSENVYAEAAQLVIDVGYAQNSAPERRWFTTNNLVMPAEGFRALGGFDASYRTAEDRDLCARWLESGRRMAYEPAAIMEHRRRVDLAEFVAMHFRYGRGSFRFHRDRRRRGAPVALEPSYYAALTRAAFDRESPGRTATLEGLLLVWHATNTAGFLYEWGRTLASSTP